MNEEKDLKDLVLEQVEKSIKEIMDAGLNPDNLESLYKLVDIHKDLKHEKYMKIKEEDIMRYGTYKRGYGEYGEGSYGERSGDNRGRYTEGYSRRGVKGTGRGRYRGEEILDDMYNTYGNYNEVKEEYNRSGNYGAKEDTMKSLDYMMASAYDFVCMLNEDAESPEEIEIIKKYTKKMSEL